MVLEREDDCFVVRTATSAAEGLDSIRDSPPDCIVSDYEMPGQSGSEFLQRVRDEYPELPFILFTGKGSEEVASDAISAGVADYLRKRSGTEQYELLANRIENAVGPRRSATQLGRQEELMGLTEVTANTGGWELDLETNDMRITTGASRIGGLEDNDIPFERALDMFHPDDREEVQAAFDRAVRTEKRVQGTWRVRTVDGDRRVLDVTITPATSDGDVTALRGAVHDVAERHQRREPLQYEETARIEGEQSHWVTQIAPVVVDGTVEYITGATRDITERGEREQELREKSNLLDESRMPSNTVEPG